MPDPPLLEPSVAGDGVCACEPLVDPVPWVEPDCDVGDGTFEFEPVVVPVVPVVPELDAGEGVGTVVDEPPGVPVPP